MTDIQKVFLTLVRIGICDSLPNPQLCVHQNSDWDNVMALANKQGLSALVIDGIEKLPECQRPSKELLLKWIGKTIQGFECRYELYSRAIAELAGFYNNHGFKMMVLKGYACSINWPIPEHRPTGDIDIWLFGDYRKADEVLKSETGISIDSSEHRHTVFLWNNFMVENHFDFLNVYHHKSNVEMEKLFKELGRDDSHFIELFGERVVIPSPNLHALFLLKHTMSHFAAESITIRHLLDWAFFVKKNGTEVDWNWLNGILDRFGMTQMYNIINSICVEDLGFESSLLPFTKVDSEIKERVLSAILSPEFSRELPNSLIKRIGWKFRRWRSNTWKHKLCYKESLWSAFWSGVWSHLLKPSSL